ncbi:MAG: TRAP transporter large permease subunit [Desulfatiglandales bacterium]|nr:TRAP transporter large permease subunit [Desulfatiglandales bacterium]
MLFNAFDTFLVSAETSNLMMDGAMALVERWLGNSAKAAILGSAAMATISGSPTANAGITGAISIPLMKKLGSGAPFTSAVEAAASTGGLIAPPVLGTTAFIMAEIIGLGYTAVIKAAIVLALLYYICLYFQLDFEAVKLILVGLLREQLPSLKNLLREYWHLLLPIILFLFLLVKRSDVMDSVIYSIGFTVVVSW